GNSSAETPPSLDGVTTLTLGMACSLVHCLSFSSVLARLVMPAATMTTATVAASAPLMRRVRLAGRGLTDSGDIQFSDGGLCCPVHAVASMDDAEHDRDENQGGDGGEDQAADDGAAQRRILFAAFAKAERHRRHADDHGKCGH